MRALQSFTLNMALFSRYVWLYLSVVCESTIYSRKLIFQEIRIKTIGFTITPKRNSCVHFALGYTRLKMYGKGTKNQWYSRKNHHWYIFWYLTTQCSHCFNFFRACVAYHRQYLCKVSMISVENKWC